MRRWIAILWHASFLVLAGCLYVLFVLPRWYELTGVWPHTLGTVMRIVCGVLIGLAALPVVFTWLRTRRPELGTPGLALNLRVWSVALHVLGGVLIVGTAISEIWLSLAGAGPWLFGIYGAAAAIALLGAFGFYLAFVAELPPPPPKLVKKRTRRRGRGKPAAAEEDAEVVEGTEGAESSTEHAATEGVEATLDETGAPTASATDGPDEAKVTPDTEEADEAEVSELDTPAEPSDTDQPAESSRGELPAEDAEPADDAGKLRNRRPSSKPTSRLFRRSRGGVAIDE